MFHDPSDHMMSDDATSTPTFSSSDTSNFEVFEFDGLFIAIFWVEVWSTQFTSSTSRSIEHSDDNEGTSSMT